MPRRPYFAPLLAALAVGCTAEGDPVAEGLDAIELDTSTYNFHTTGDFSGMALDLHLSDDPSLDGGGEREYRGPHLPGTDPMDEIPDLDQTELCEVGVEFPVELDGVAWTIDFEFENFVAADFGVGAYAIVGPDEEASPGRAAVEFQMTSEASEYEKTALSGDVAVDVFDSDGTHVDTDRVEEGGAMGVRFHLEFGPGEILEGSFYFGFGPSDVQGKEC